MYENIVQKDMNKFNDYKFYFYRIKVTTKSFSKHMYSKIGISLHLCSKVHLGFIFLQFSNQDNQEAECRVRVANNSI